MTNPGTPRVVLTDAERRFLEAPRLAHLATVAATGAPHVVPVWYLLEGNVFVFTTVMTRRTARYLQRDPRVAFVVDDALPEGRQGIEIDAVAAFVPEDAARVAHALARRYLGEHAGAPYAEGMLRVPGRSAFRAEPRRIRAWGL